MHDTVIVSTWFGYVSGSNADWLKIGSEHGGSDSKVHRVEGEHLWFLWLIERVTTLKEE